MTLQTTILAIYLSLALLFSNIARGLAIPSTSNLIQTHLGPGSHGLSHQNQPHSPGIIQSVTSNQHPMIDALAKGDAYNLPETIPKASKIAERLTTLREAGFVPSSAGQHHQQDQPQTTTIDTSPPGRVMHTCEMASGFQADLWSAGSTVTELPLPPLGLFIFASGIVCVATIVSKLRMR